MHCGQAAERVQLGKRKHSQATHQPSKQNDNFHLHVTLHSTCRSTQVYCSYACIVFMVSPEERNRKPYALPVQCIPYKGLTDAKVRHLANKVIHEMTLRK